MRLAGTMLSTSVQAERQGPSMTTRSPESRTRSNRSRKGPTCPPGLARMRTSAWAGGVTNVQSIAAMRQIPARNARMAGASFHFPTQDSGYSRSAKPAPRFRRTFVGSLLSVASPAAQGRQSDAGRIEAAIDGKNLSGNVARPVAAKEEDRLGQLLLEAVAVDRDRIVIVGADFPAVNRFRHRGVDRSRRHAVDADAEF